MIFSLKARCCVGFAILLLKGVIYMSNLIEAILILCTSIGGISILCIYKGKDFTTKFNFKKDSVELEISITKELDKKEN